MTARILIVDDMSINRELLRNILEQDFFIVGEAESASDALCQLNHDHYDLILLDVYMPHMSGYELCRKLRQDPATARLPIIMITSAMTVKERNDGFMAGADDYLPKPVNRRVLLARIKNLLRVKQLSDELHLRQLNAQDFGIESPNIERTSHTKLLWVGEVNENSAELKNAIENDPLFHPDYHADFSTVMVPVNSGGYDAIVISAQDADANQSLRLVANIRADWRHRELVIIFLSDKSGESGLRALDLGASDYMSAPYSPTEMKMRLKTQLARKNYAEQLRELLNQQLRLSVIDPLTELHNRRYLEFYFPKIQAQAQRAASPVAVMILDIDRFKSINDTYGHDFGDYVLVEFARRMRDGMRAADLITRFGGEEFVIVTPGADAQTAPEIAERIRHMIQEKPFENDGGEHVTVTVSIGVTMVKASETDLDAIIRRADEALYRAKRNGRNQFNFEHVA